MNTFAPYPLQRARGFSLVEIMVALVIGMIAMVVVMQLYGASEAKKRTTTGADDAQISGALGLFALQRDIRQSGYGIGSYDMLGCSLTLRPGVVLPALAPVIINPKNGAGGSLFTGQDDNTDTLLVVYGNSDSVTEGNTITSQPSTKIYPLDSVVGLNVNDRVIAFPQNRPTPCSLSLDTITQLPTVATDLNVTVANGVNGMSGGKLYDLGQSPTIVAYAVRKGSLTRCDYMVNNCSQNVEANWTPIAGNIASLLAQYGRDDTSVNATMTGIVNRYDNTVQVPPAVSVDQCGWARISAVRFALLAQNGQYDKSTTPYATTVVPTWEGSVANNPAGSAASPFDLSKFTPSVGNWKNYRYKVYQTVVPIKNVNWLWMGGQTGC